MSKDVDRDQVFLTTRVRTSLKNDGSWIQKSKQAIQHGDHAVQDKPVLVRQNSYVLSTAQKYDDSVNKANCEVIPPQTDAQPEGSTVKATDDTMPQASTEKRVQNDEAQPEKSEAVSLMEPGEQPVNITTAEEKDECVDTPVDQSKVDLNEKAAEASADDHSEVLQNGETQPVLKEITEVVYPVEPSEKSVSNTVSENKEGNVGALINQSEVEHSEEAAKSSADVLQPFSTEKIEAVSPLESAEQPVANTTVEKKEEYVQAPVDQSNVEQNEDAAQSSAKVRVDESFEVQSVSTEKTEAVSPLESAEQPVANTTVEKKEEYVQAPVDQSNVEQNEDAAQSSAKVRVDESFEVQSVSTEKTEAVSPLESAEQPVANTTVEKKEEYVKAPVDQSNVEHNEDAAQSSAKVRVDESFEVQSVSTEKTEAVSPLESAEQPVANTTVEKKEEYVQAPVDQSNVEQNEDAAQSSAKVRVDESFEVQSVSTEKTEAVSPLESAEQPVANTTVEKKEEYVQAPVDQSNVENNEDAAQSSAKVRVDESFEVQSVSTEKTEAVSFLESAEQLVANTTAEKKEDYVITPVDQLNVEYNNMAADASASVYVEAPVAKTSAEAGTEDRKEAAEVLAVLTGELKPETEPTNVTNHEPAGVESNAHPAEGSCEKCPEKFTEETLETVAEVVEESLPETPPAVTNAAAAAQEAAIQDSVEPVLDLQADTVSDLPTQPAAETAVKSLESKAESADTAQPVLNTGAEEENKIEVQAAKNTAVEPTPETAADDAAELRIEDAVEPATTSAEAVQDKLVVRAIELTDALDVEAPTVDANPESVKDPKQPQSEEVKPNQKSDDTNTDKKAVCSFCDQTIDGNVRLIFSEPALNCHPDCLMCGVCTEALGNLSTPMFLHDQVIHCGRCFAKALKT